MNHRLNPAACHLFQSEPSVLCSISILQDQFGRFPWDALVSSFEKEGGKRNVWHCSRGGKASVSVKRVEQLSPLAGSSFRTAVTEMMLGHFICHSYSSMLISKLSSAMMGAAPCCVSFEYRSGNEPTIRRFFSHVENYGNNPAQHCMRPGCTGLAKVFGDVILTAESNSTNQSS